MPETEICGVKMPDLTPGILHYCARERGHTGWHMCSCVFRYAVGDA